MSNPKQTTLKEQITQDIFDWIRQVELYFENNPISHIILKVSIFIFGLLSALVDATEIAQNYWSPTVSWIILLSLLAVVLVVDYGHVFIAKRRLVEINRIRRLITNMTQIIRNASDLNAPAYTITDWFIEHDISSNGDVQIIRDMKIGYISDTVYWAKVPIGVIDGETEDKAEDLNIKVTNPKDGGTLPYMVISETKTKKELAIMLEPPARLTQDAEFRLSCVWRGAYTPLIRTHTDHGKITVQHFAKEVTLKFIAPPELEFTGIRMINNIGLSEIRRRDDDRSILIWYCGDMVKGEYTYSLICKKKES